MDNDDTTAAIGAAIRERLEHTGRSQAWLGAEVAALEQRPDPYSQAMVSDWLQGRYAIPPARLFLIEQALSVRAGSISRLAGYLPVGTRTAATVEAVLAEDPDITADQADLLMAAYTTARAQTRARRLKRGR